MQRYCVNRCLFKEEKTPQRMNVKNLVLGIGIFIVYLLMLGYGIEAFYPSPQYDKFCTGTDGGRYTSPQPYPLKGIESTSAGNCTFIKSVQEQTEQCANDGGFAVYAYDDAGCVSSVKECNLCQKNYDSAQKAYSKVLFLIAMLAGILTLFLGYKILSVEPVGSALMASGVGAMLYGSIRNWQNLSDIWRFLLLLVALILLIWIALRINKHR